MLLIEFLSYYTWWTLNNNNEYREYAFMQDRMGNMVSEYGWF